ncbi:MAG TPA: hypothetical protein VGP33_18660, partial [Chloroflexota bacterium]|nr:hypothetical protein [Chloroflexota bacterium]
LAQEVTSTPAADMAASLRKRRRATGPRSISLLLRGNYFQSSAVKVAPIFVLAVSGRPVQPCIHM